MKRIGVDLGVLRDSRDDGMSVVFVHPACPGARVLVTKEDLAVMRQGGEEFQDDQTLVPRDGYGTARVRCGRPVEAWVGCAGHVVYAGLCHSCSSLESDNRSTLRLRQNPGRGSREAAE
jgi:hypothetical protein